MQEKKLFLLDGHALVYRAHFAFINRPLINSKGINTSAITGFVRTLWDLMRNQKPSHIAVFFDLDTPTFRHKMYEPYKANRESQPEDIQVAFPFIRKIVEGFNIPIVEMDGFEADDVIGTIAKQAELEGFTVYMVTPDKDYAQLVSDHIYLYKPSRQGNGIDILGVPEILESWDIQRIDQVIDVLGLKGDTVDNIPGIPGVGEKTAVQLLKDYGSVEEVIAHVEDLKGKLKERVEMYAEQALLSKKLATIDINAPVRFDAKAYEIEPVNREALTEIFKELEFRTLAHAILGEEGQETQKDLFGNPVDKKVADKLAAPAPATYAVADKNAENTKHTYLLVDKDDELQDLIRNMEKLEKFCFDTETTGLDPNEAELVGLSIAWQDHYAYYIPFPSDQEAARKRLHLFKAVFENPGIAKIGQNIKYDLLMLKWYGIEVQGALLDTMIAHYLMEPDQRHKLDNLSENYLNYKMIPIEDLIGRRGAKQLSMRDVDKQKVKEYAAEDADITWQLYHELFPKAQEEQVLQVYDSIEQPLIQVLASMEYEGVKVDGQMLAVYSEQLARQIIEEERTIYKLAGVDFNIASPKQVGEVLFEKLKLPYRWRKTSTGQYSTDEDKLSELALQFDIVAHIQDHRKLSKLKSTYVDALPNMINPRTGRIHTSYNQARAATGRLSSENPNLQNIPIRDEAGREIRKAFVPRDDNHILLSADYSQIELRLIADLSHEEAMLEAFEQNLDIHRSTAARVYGVALDEVTADQRRNAKTVNFSIIYGAGSLNLSRQLGIKRAEASQLIDNYFKQYKGLKAYMEQTVSFAREHGYVKTLSGRRRILRDINSRNGLSRSNAERIAINTPIQGTAADMIKLAMIAIHDAFSEAGIQSKMILQVHDELVFDVLPSEMEHVKRIVEDKMKKALPNLKVPIEVGMGTGMNWLEAH